MTRFEITPFSPTGSNRRDVLQLIADSENFDGYRPLNDQSWLELSQHTGTGARHPAIGTAWGYLAKDAENGQLCGYVHISTTNQGTAIEIAVSPACRSDYLEIASALARKAIAGLGPAAYPVSLWALRSNTLLEEAARFMGMKVSRELYQMRRALPLEAEDTEPDPLVLRTFRPGQDELSWLELNNRAFASHPEQGRWDLNMLAAREQEPWFDPQGFILGVDANRLAGACWTKIHPGNLPSYPPMGEIYVICVDPTYQGRGVSAPLLRAGLDHLSSRGLRIAMLYVDSDNAAALKLYERFGFKIDHTDRAFTLDEPPGHFQKLETC
ncbi:MAG: mycothiol synthase [Actinobacteria bacterium]|nr:mycothiol synthase [Actinomycetota bacterium]MCL5447394.1 mycothiol synthase [Actinomycetota bacterium]